MSKYIIDSSFDSGDYYMHPSKGLTKRNKNNKFIEKRPGSKYPDHMYPIMSMGNYKTHLERYKKIIDRTIRKYEKDGILKDIRGKIASLNYYHCHVDHMWMYPSYVTRYINYVDLEDYKGNIGNEDVDKKAYIKLKTASFEIYRIINDIKRLCRK